MLAQLAWLGVGFIIGSKFQYKVSDYMEKNFKDELDALEKAKKQVARANKDLGEAMRAKWSGTLVTSASPDIDSLLKNLNKPSKDDTLSAILDGISKAMKDVDWDALKKEADAKRKAWLEKAKKEFQGGNFDEKSCCGGADDDCCR